MSMQKKLIEAATIAANEARLREKARILWLLDELKRQTQAGMERKLISSAELHAAQVRLRLAVNIIDTVRRWVLSDVRPAEDLETDPIAAKLKELEDAAGQNPVE